jgi:hypothetical protein
MAYKKEFIGDSKGYRYREKLVVHEQQLSVDALGNSREFNGNGHQAAEHPDGQLLSSEVEPYILDPRLSPPPDILSSTVRIIPTEETPEQAI